MRGAPWLGQQVPVDQGVSGLAIAPPLPRQIHAPEILRGPPVPGAPWLQGAPTSRSVPIEGAFLPQVPAPPDIARQVYAPEIFTGPVRGPWAQRMPALVSMPVAPVPPAPPPAAPDQTGVARPFLVRDPRRENEEQRLRRFTEQLSAIVNSLVGQGSLVQTGPASWRIAGGVVEGDGAPTANHDETLGYTRGLIYIDANTQDVYICKSNAEAAAVWTLIA